MVVPFQGPLPISQSYGLPKRNTDFLMRQSLETTGLKGRLIVTLLWIYYPTLDCRLNTSNERRVKFDCRCQIGQTPFVHSDGGRERVGPVVHTRKDPRSDGLLRLWCSMIVSSNVSEECLILHLVLGLSYHHPLFLRYFSLWIQV